MDRQAYHWHTRTKTAKAHRLQDAAPQAFVSLNPTDADQLGVVDGDRVRIVSRRGAVVARQRWALSFRPVWCSFHSIMGILAKTMLRTI